MVPSPFCEMEARFAGTMANRSAYLGDFQRWLRSNPSTGALGCLGKRCFPRSRKPDKAKRKTGSRKANFSVRRRHSIIACGDQELDCRPESRMGLKERGSSYHRGDIE